MYLFKVLLILGLGLSFDLGYGYALKVPFRPKDVLPVLPKQISWPVLNNFHSAVDLLPAFVGSVTPHGLVNQWKGSCFNVNEARLDFTQAKNQSLGGGVLYLKVLFLSFTHVCL